MGYLDGSGCVIGLHPMEGLQLLFLIVEFLVQYFVFAEHYLQCTFSDILVAAFWSERHQPDMVAMVMGVEDGVDSTTNLIYGFSGELWCGAPGKVAPQIDEDTAMTGSDFGDATANLIGSAMDGDFHVCLIFSVGLFVNGSLAFL